MLGEALCCQTKELQQVSRLQSIRDAKKEIGSSLGPYSFSSPNPRV